MLGAARPTTGPGAAGHPGRGRVIVGGEFTTSTAPRPRLGAVDATTGASARSPPTAPSATTATAGFYSLRQTGPPLRRRPTAPADAGNFEGVFAATEPARSTGWPTATATRTAFRPGQGGVLGRPPARLRQHRRVRRTEPASGHRATASRTRPPGRWQPQHHGGYADFYGQRRHRRCLVPDLDRRQLHRQRQAAWSVTATADYVVMGGEFPKVNERCSAGVGPLRGHRAWRRTSRARSRPRARAPTVQSNTTARSVSWRTNGDRGRRQNLTYKVYRRRRGTTPSVSTITQTSNSGTAQSGLLHTGLVPGTGTATRSSATDPSGNDLGAGDDVGHGGRPPVAGRCLRQDVTEPVRAATGGWTKPPAPACGRRRRPRPDTGTGVTRGTGGASTATATRHDLQRHVTGVADPAAVYPAATNISVAAWVKAGSTGSPAARSSGSATPLPA